jgi:hypothetical protein
MAAVFAMEAGKSTQDQAQIPQAGTTDVKGRMQEIP